MSTSYYVAPEIKIEAVQYYQTTGKSLNQTASRYGVNRSTLQKWILNYELFGVEGLQHRRGNNRYPEEVKRQAVEDYVSGCMSEEQICKKYQIRSRTQLETWILLYTGQKEYRPAGGTRRGRKVTRISEERKQEAVEYCITNGRDYSLTAAHMGFTYQQVYGWVRKYHKAGVDALAGKRRGKRVSPYEKERPNTDSGSLEIELAVYRKLQQYRRQGHKQTYHSTVRFAMEYLAVKELHEDPIYKLCVVAKVSRAGYYKWLKRPASKKQIEDEKLSQLITKIYSDQNGVPGYRQMKIILERRYGIKCNIKRIQRLMGVLGLRSVCRKRKRRPRKKCSAEYIAENILNREFTSNRPNEKWLTDVTELKYGVAGKAYLSAILDLYGNHIVAFSLSGHNNTALVLDTFEQAFQRYPDAKPLLHSDRGVQYTSRSFMKRMKVAGVCQSMSRPGRCLDNAPMEGFWAILKTEMYYLSRFDDYESLYDAICRYFDFYNNHRYQRNLGCLTPAEFISQTK